MEDIMMFKEYTKTFK